jgi:DNA polymerase I-like protein with 3'-5' exonuclease and polymerase domains
MIVDNHDKFQKCLNWIKKQDVIAFDVETDGLNTRKNKVIGFGIGNADSGFYIKDEEKAKVILNKLHGKKLIAWNAYFDLEMTKNTYNVDLWDSLYLDCICLKHTVDEIPPFGLKEVASKILGTDSKDEQKELKASIKANGGSVNEFFKADLSILAKYCIKDCTLTYQLYEYYIEELKEQKLEKFFFEDEVMPLYKEVTRHMQSRGIPVDVTRLEKAQKDISNDVIKLENEIQESIEPYLDIFMKWLLNKDYTPKRSGKFAQKLIELSGKPIKRLRSGKFSLAASALQPYETHPFIGYLLSKRLLSHGDIRRVQNRLLEDEKIKYPFNLQSKHHLKKLFFDTLQETPVSKTLKGNPQVDELFLNKMSQKYQWVQKLQDYNKLNKLKSTYIDRILELQEDGIFFPQFWQHRTISGRYGSDLQQLPRLAEEGQFTPLITGYRNQIRSFFIAGEDHKFIDADYESLEPHIFAHVSNEEKIRDIFRKGQDFYSEIAIQTESLDGVSSNKLADNYLGKVDKRRRQRAKAYSLGIPYGMESFALGKNLEIDQKTADRLIKSYLERFPNLNNWMKETEELFKLKGKVESQAGRVRRFSKGQKLLLKYGAKVLNSLTLWEDYNHNPRKYAEMKEIRKVIKNSLNNAKNFQIQSLAASITNRACIQINRLLKDSGIDGYVCAQIHDEILVRVPAKWAKSLKTPIEGIIENNYKISVPLKAPASIGDNYGEVK